MTAPRKEVLVLCYGNPGRLDDGLGPALGEALEKTALPNVTVDIDYQLTVEDAAAAAQHRTVIFADAAVQGREPFFFQGVAPQASLSFSSHSVEPPALLALAQELFERAPQGYALGIRGYEFNEFGEQQLSPKAQENLAAALAFLIPLLRTGRFAEAAEKMSEPGLTESRPEKHGDSSCKTEST